MPSMSVGLGTMQRCALFSVGPRKGGRFVNGSGSSFGKLSVCTIHEADSANIHQSRVPSSGERGCCVPLEDTYREGT